MHVAYDSSARTWLSAVWHGGHHFTFWMISYTRVILGDSIL